MIHCIVIGDSLAVGIAHARPDCVSAAQVGISSSEYATTRLGGIETADIAIISLGANDGAGTPTEENLRRVRNAVIARSVVWLVPNASTATRAAIATVAAEQRDGIIDVRPLVGPDGIHPAAYATLAEQTRMAETPPAASAPSAEAGLLTCGPTVEPTTLRAIMRVESDARPFALYVNGALTQPAPARSAAEATATAESWIARGFSVDLGLMQVNSRNLTALGSTVAEMFDPCANVRAGAAILTADYLSAVATRPDPQTALRAALSAYNTGSFERGFYNGYVAKYYGPGAGARDGPIITAAALRPARPSAALNPYTADPTVYHRSSTDE